MIKHLLFFNIFLFSYINIDAQSCVWVKSSQNRNKAFTNDIVLDIAGNSYLVGAFTNTIDLDPGPGSYVLTAKKAYDMFISKLDINGNFVWAINIGGSRDDFATSIAYDKNGFLYVTGQFCDTVDFDPSVNISNLININSVLGGFLLKLDLNGNYISAFNLPNWKRGFTVKCDSLGNIYLAGGIVGVVDFDLGINVLNVGQIAKESGFVAKYDPLGNILFSKAFTYSTGACSNLSFAYDSNFNIYACGFFYGTIDNDPGPTTYYQTSANGGGYLCKLDSVGNFKWAGAIKGNSVTEVYSINVDKNDNIYVTGNFNGTVDFSPLNGIYNITSNGSNEIFVLRIDNNGALIWVKKFDRDASFGTNIPYKIISDINNNIYITGVFCGNTDFDPNLTSYFVGSFNNEEGFILKLSSLGGFIGLKHIAGTTTIDSPTSIAIDQNLNIYSTGFIMNYLNSINPVIDFDSPNNCNYIFNDSVRVFISKYSQIVGINENIVETKLDVFPNPTLDRVNINLNRISKTLDVTVLNIYGQQVKRELLYNINNISIELPDISGIYIIKIISDGEAYYHKVEKL